MMKPKLLIWLCLLVACSTDNAVTPLDDAPHNLAMMTATMWDQPFFGAKRCDGGAGPPAALPSFWAKRTVDGARFDADLSEVAFRSGNPSPLGLNTKLFTGDGAVYLLANVGHGTIQFTRFDDTQIAGSFDTDLVRRDGTPVHFAGTFSADPFLGTASVEGLINGVQFQSDIGEEHFPRARARVCIADTSFSGGIGAAIAITMDKISPSFLGSYPVFSTNGPATITVEHGGEFYNGVSGTLDILGVDSVAVEDSLGMIIRYNRVITDATFSFVGVNLIVFGDENKDTVRLLWPRTMNAS